MILGDAAVVAGPGVPSPLRTSRSSMSASPANGFRGRQLVSASAVRRAECPVPPALLAGEVRAVGDVGNAGGDGRTRVRLLDGYTGIGAGALAAFAKPVMRTKLLAAIGLGSW